MASVLAQEATRTARGRGLLPNVRPVTTLLATGIVWITGLLVACGIAAGYLRQQVLNTTADELGRLDTVLAEAVTRSLLGSDLKPESVANLRAILTAVPLAEDASIALMSTDGRVLFRYPDRATQSELAAAEPHLRPVVAPDGVTTVHQIGSDQGQLRIEAIRPVPGYPLAISISRGAAAALADWKRQVLMLSIFALGGAVGIAVMIYLIARQIRVHDDLAAARAEKLEAERARLEAEAKLLKVERLAVMGQVTGAVAHELRIPLSAIRETLGTLKEMIADSGSELDRPVARMERSIERCDRMSSDLLEYTRARELQPTTLGFDAWLDEVIADLTIPAQIKLSAELRAGTAAALFDPDRIRRVLADLIENACHAIAELPRHYEKRITLRTGVAPGMVVLTVADTGSGIAPENRQHIFDPLFSTKSFGTGLGLPIVKQIVDQHGGTIRIDSEVGHGTRVRVCLPLSAEAIPERKAAA